MIFVFAHADPSTVRERYTGLLPAGSALRPFVLPGGSSAAYEQHARALRAQRRSVAAGLRATYAADRPADEPMVLVTFSAGYGLARELLRDTDPGIAALVLLDSLHASFEGDGTPLDAQLAPFVAYAKRAQRGEVAFWMGHSDVQTPQTGPGRFASTTQTAAELVRLAGEPSGLFHVEAFNVRGAAHAKEEHMAALREWGPEFVAACVSALTGESVPSTQPRPTPVTHGALPPVLRRGDKGEAVGAWQVELGRAGFRTDVDRDFGPRTEMATKRLQMAARIDQDGVVGPATRAAAKRLAGDTEPAPSPIPFVQARNYKRIVGPRQVGLVVLHSMESAEKPDTAEAVAAWFASAKAPMASAHYCVDSNSVVQCVREEDVAYAAPGANHNGIHVEIAGRASQSSADWSDTYSQATIARAAKLVADICVRHTIMPVAVDVAGLLRGERGITTHAAVSKAFKKSTHWDPGPSFPLDRLVELAARG